MKRKRSIYYQRLDFIRLFACLAIIFYHLNILKGGYLAVCIFLVLSGYLAVISAFNAAHFSLKEYYKNRFLKIYLPLLVVVFLSVAFITLIPQPTWLNLKPEVTSIIFGYNNFWQLSVNLDYFARHVSSPFMHLWYIAILLQFEIVFPFIFLGLRKLGQKVKPYLPPLITGLLSIGGTIYFTYAYYTQNLMVTYYSTFTRAFSLFFGLTLGFMHMYYKKVIKASLKDNQKQPWVMGTYFGLLIILCLFVNSSSQLMPWAMIGVTLITCRLIDYATFKGKIKLAKREKATKYLASLSYEFYLWQYPVIYVLGLYLTNCYLIAFLTILITISLSWLTHWLLNHHFAKNNKGKYVAWGLLLAATLIGLGKYLGSKNYQKEMRNLEAELNANTKLLETNQAEYALKQQEAAAAFQLEIAKMDVDPEKLQETITNMPVVGVGDSVMLGAVTALMNKFPNGYFDAKVSRTGYAANEILVDLKNKNMLGDAIIFNLGTNGDCGEKCREEIMTTIGEREVFWITVTNDKDVHVNAKLVAFAEKHANLHIIDWEKISAGHSEYFAHDGIHLTGTGRKVYADTIYQAIYDVYLAKAEAKKNDYIAKHEQEQQNRYSFYGNDLLLNIFNDLKPSFEESYFSIKSDYDFASFKSDLERQIADNTLTNNLVWLFDQSFNLTLEEYQTIFDLLGNRQVTILSLDKKSEETIQALAKDNIKILSFASNLDNNEDYLVIDKIHFTAKGNGALSKFILKNLEQK